MRALITETRRAAGIAGAFEENLFDFGDLDGPASQAKLQHPLGVNYCPFNKTLFIADTYNHKIKMIENIGCTSAAD